VGYWGLTLAPVVQDLSDYALAATGRSAADESLAVFAVGHAEREAWPYQVDLRGAGAAPDAVWASASRANAVYLTDYLPGGGLALREVGAVRLGFADPEADPLASLGDPAAPVARLLAAQVEVGQPRLRLTWQPVAGLPADATIFVHVWQAGELWGSADGDSLGGLLPLWAWQPGGTVEDVRDLGPAGLRAGDYALSVGLYRRWDGTRYPAYAPDGQRWPGDEVPAGRLTLREAGR
jgi:hypothetical protein